MAGVNQLPWRMPKSIHSSRHQRLMELLVDARHSAGLTQAAVADRLGRPQSFVAKYENGERRIDVIEFLQLTEVIGANPRKLLAKLLAVQE